LVAFHATDVDDRVKAVWGASEVELHTIGVVGYPCVGDTERYNPLEMKFAVFGATRVRELEGRQEHLVTSTIVG